MIRVRIFSGQRNLIDSAGLGYPDRSRARSVRDLMTAARTERIANDSPFCEAHGRVDDLIKKLTSAEAMSATLTDIERLLAKEGTEFLRGLLQAYVDARSAAEQPVSVVGADGVPRPHARPAPARWRRRSAKSR